MTTTTSADQGAIEQMAADLEHAARMGHRMIRAVRQAGAPGWRDAYGSTCNQCMRVLVVYVGGCPAHHWDGIDLPCRGGG